MALCETNLGPDISSSDFGVDGYLPVIRKDSSRHMHGLAVYIRCSLPVARACDFESPSHSYMCFRMTQLATTTFLFFAYRSPSGPDCSILDDISIQMDKALMSCPSAKFVIMGDFNAHHTTWLNSAKTDMAGVRVHNFAITESLTQMVDFETRFPDNPAHTPSCLDLCFASHPDEISSIGPLPQLGKSDHIVLRLSLKLPSASAHESPYHRVSYNYERGKWDAFRDFLRDLPWDGVFSLPADSCATEIAEWLRIGIEEFIPHRRYQVKPHSVPWFSPDCSAAIATRNHHYHCYRSNPSTSNRASFRKARNDCEKVLKAAESRYIESTKSKISDQTLGSKDFWRILNSVLNRGKSSVPPLVSGSQIIQSSKGKAEVFATMFAEHCRLSSAPKFPPYFEPRKSSEDLSETGLDDIQFTPFVISRVLSKLDTASASGPDRIPAIVLKQLAPELSPILSKLFNKCIKESVFPNCWKCASVVPAFKNCGDRTDPTKYRPISLLPIISKVFERVINNKIIGYLESSGLLSDKQYGFRHQRSTADLLTVVTERIYRALDRCGEAKSVALDISKAFDRVWHEGLLKKIHSYGISGKIFSILKAFLSDRKLHVVIDGQQSETHSISSGVPQGSILGPTLFLIYINDLPDELICKLVIYADDTTLYSCLDGKAETEEQRLALSQSLESDLSRISDWGKKWQVTLNSEKTKVLSANRYVNPEATPISMSGTTLEESSSIRLVGLTLSKDLTWNEYISSIAKKASMKVGSLYRARRCLSPEVILHLYKSLIRPCMEYCCHIWAGASVSMLNMLDRIQRRVIYMVGPKLSSNLQSLSHRRNVASLSLFYRYYNGMCSSELSTLVPTKKVFGRPTRLASLSHRFTVEVPFCRTQFYKRSFFPRTACLWNSLPAHCFPERIDLNCFKSRVNRHLLESDLP